MGGGTVRVLWLAKGLGPGGTERLLVSLARTLDPSRVSCQAAYLLPEKDQLVSELAAAGVESTCLDGGAVGWAGRLRQLVHGQGIDIVHIHSPHPAAVARPALRVQGRHRPSIVYTEHNSWGGYGAATRWVNAATYPFDDARLAVSPAALASIPRVLRGRTEVLIHGVELAEVRSHSTARAAMRGRLGVDDDTVLVVTIANLRAHKDYPTLLRAARLAVDSGAPLRFVAVGQGPLDAQLRADSATQGLGDHFEFLGYRPDALDVLAAADLFALSSLAEGYPVSLMEALALGVPVVATAVGGIPDAIRAGIEGNLVPPSRPDLLAEALVALARDPLRRAGMSLAAAARASRFDIRRAAARHHELYDEMAALAVTRRRR